MTITGKRYLAWFVFSVALIVAGVGIWAHFGMSRAKQLATHGLWRRVRDELRWYRLLHPRDDQARMLLAEATIKDQFETSEKGADEALVHLSAIGDQSPLAEVARVQEGRLNFLVLLRVSRAEESLTRALQINPKNLEAVQLLSKLYEMTNRFQQTEDFFWTAYELTPLDERPLRLREWYLSQFFPLSSNEDLDRKLGFVNASEYSTRSTESRRYIQYRESEKDRPLGSISLAKWCQQEGQPDFAKQLLDDVEVKFPNAIKTREYVNVRVATLFDLGELEDAAATLKDWPEPRDGFDFWKLSAMILEEADGEYDKALAAYDRALTIWPGQADWRLRHRKAACLIRLGRLDDAAEERNLAGKIERLMEDDVHSRLRSALGNLADAGNIADVIRFYQTLKCPREAAAWQQHADRIAKLSKR